MTVVARSRSNLEHDPVFRKDHAQTQSAQQQSGRWTGQDARMNERMDAIRNMRTMAGSPDADHGLRSASRHLAHGFCVLEARSFVKP
ncbi:hypothetical protein J6497_10190 [Bradyrhizobium sp. CNPSo 4026]|nr:hypothetical protein [Bradyrhizobium cenepequi]